MCGDLEGHAPSWAQFALLIGLDRANPTEATAARPSTRTRPQRVPPSTAFGCGRGLC